MKKALILLVSVLGVGYAQQPTQINAGQAVQFQTTPSSTQPQQTGLHILDNSSFQIPIFDNRINGITGALNFHQNIQAFTANTTLTLSQMSGLILNKGATGAVTLTLPVPTGGQFAAICVDTAQTFNITASTALFRYGATTGVTLSSATLGSCVQIKSTSAARWYIDVVAGTWTMDSIPLSPVTPSSSGEITPYNLPIPAKCNGIDDDSLAFLSITPNMSLVIPEGVTCVISGITMQNNTMIRGTAGSKLLKTSGSASTYMFNIASSNVTLKDIWSVDFNGITQTTTNNAYIFLNNPTNILIQGINFTNSGTPPVNARGILAFNGSGRIQNNNMDATVTGRHFILDGRPGTNKSWVFDGNKSIGSAEAGFYITNSTNPYVPGTMLNVILSNNTVENTTAQSGSTGQSGNCYNIFQADGVQLIGNTCTNPRFSAWRLNKSVGSIVSGNKATAGSNGGESCAYAELGAFNNTFIGNECRGFPSGFNMTNVSSRGTDAPNFVIGNFCFNSLYYCYAFEHDYGWNNEADGVPIGYIVGRGNTTHDNTMGNNRCDRTDTTTPPMVICTAVDQGVNSGTDTVSNTVRGTTTVASTIWPTNLPGNLVVTGITTGATTTVNYTGSAPTDGTTWCGAQIEGMTQIDGICGTIASHTASSFVININSTGFSPITIPTGGPTPNFFQIYGTTSGVASSTLPSSLKNLNFDSAYVTLTDGATVTWPVQASIVGNASITLGGNRTLVVQNLLNGGEYNLKVIQDATGNRGLTLGSGCTWKVSGGGAGAITPSTAANAVDLLNFTYDGTNCNAIFTKNFN